MFFFQGEIEQGREFFSHLWPDARAVADTPRTFYRAFGIKRGGMKEMFGPEVWACGVRAALKGNFIGTPVGDPLQMPGVFVLDRTGTVRYEHTFRHAGDHPDFAALPERLYDS